MTSLISGINVVELSTMITAPLAGMMLADWGATVIKVEKPESGDPFRNFRDGLYSPHFCAYNRNKESITLDLHLDECKSIFVELIKKADVFIENFRPATMDSFGFSDEKLKEINPQLIRCHITGFGPDGPYSERPAYDAIAQALSGISSLYLSAEDSQITGPTISDNVTAHYACQGILAALYERTKTNLGRRLDVNMLESSLAFIPDPFAYLTQLKLVSDPLLRAKTSQSYAFSDSNGKMFAVHLSSQPKFWKGFIYCLELPNLAQDERFLTRALRIDNYLLIKDIAAEILVKNTREHWLTILVNMDIPAAPIYDVTEVFNDPQVKYLDSFVDLTHPIMGVIKTIRRPVWLDGHRSDQELNAPPMLGENSQDIIKNIHIGVIR